MKIEDAAKTLGINPDILRTLMECESSRAKSPNTDAAKGIMILPLEKVIGDIPRYGLRSFHGVPNMTQLSNGPYVKAEDYDKLRQQFLELLWKSLDGPE